MIEILKLEEESVLGRRTIEEKDPSSTHKFLCLLRRGVEASVATAQ